MKTAKAVAQVDERIGMGCCDNLKKRPSCCGGGSLLAE